MGLRGPRKECEIVAETLERAVSLVVLSEEQAKRMAEWAASPIIKLKENAKAEALEEVRKSLVRLIEVTRPVAEAKSA